MSGTASQTLAITLANLRTLPARKTAALVAAIGIAGVVAILVGVLSIREGFKAALDNAGSDDVAIVLRGGSAAELSSGLTLEQTRIISGNAHVLKDNDVSIASPELYVIVDVPMRTTGTDANVPLRGISASGAKLRRDFKLVSGRMFTPGRFEVIVGQGAANQFRGLQSGSRVRWGTVDWNVVGVFADGGSVSESEIWSDATVVQGAYRRGATFQSVRVKLPGADAIRALKDDLTSDPRLNVTVQSERHYYASQSKSLSTLINTVGYTVAALMGLGALFGALNTMYSAVSARTREIATLRALGFGSGPVVTSVVTESLLLGLIGGLLGCLIAYLGFNGIRTSTLNWNSFTQLSFAFTVTPTLLLHGLLYALVLALIGGIMPGWRAARLPIVSGLREL